MAALLETMDYVYSRASSYSSDFLTNHPTKRQLHWNECDEDVTFRKSDVHANVRYGHSSSLPASFMSGNTGYVSGSAFDICNDIGNEYIKSNWSISNAGNDDNIMKSSITLTEQVVDIDFFKPKKYANIHDCERKRDCIINLTNKTGELYADTINLVAAGDVCNGSRPTEDYALSSSCADISSPTITVSHKRHIPVHVSNGDSIKAALDRVASCEEELVADFSRPCQLPTFRGKHGDLNAISASTMACIIQDNRFSVTIVDCRYPYEYNGGHVRGSSNMYTASVIHEAFISGMKPLNCVTTERKILVFHCEFSSHRGPRLLRYLREQDRVLNSESYPCLLYPEVYILEGGYHAFHEFCHKTDQHQLCEGGYRPMLADGFLEELKYFRSESKCNDGRKQKGNRTRSRLLF